MSRNYKELQEKLIALFIEYEVVAQGYEMELWTKDQQEEAKKKYPNQEWAQKPFNDVVRRSVEHMF